MEQRRSRNPLAIIIVFFLIIIGGGVIYLIHQSNLDADDASALYGGKLESGYPSAGYLISYSPGGGFKTCGYAALSNTVAVTASHCVDDSESIYLGKGDFTVDKLQQIEVIRAVQKDGWVNGKKRAEDFAVLNLAPSRYLNSYAKVVSPIEGCHYRVVAYGRTENPEESGTKPRKSASFCATQIDRETFQVVGNDAGICFGDSGSPIYIDGTDQLVGVIASIVKKYPDDTNPCDFGNTAIVVRADSNLRIINDNLKNNDPLAEDIPVSETLIIDVVEETFLEQIGLEALQNISEEEKQTLGILAAVVSALFLVLAGVVMVVMKGKEEEVL